MKKFKLIQLVAALLLLASYQSWGQTNVGQFASWNGSTFGTIPNVTGMTFSQLVRGSITTESAGDGINSSGFNQSTIAAAITNNDYLTFNVTAGNTTTTRTAFRVTSLSIGVRRSGTGPLNLQVRYSVNGGAYSDFGSSVAIASNTSNQTLSATGTADADPGEVITFRIYAWGASGAGGTMRILNGTSVNSTYAVITDQPDNYNMTCANSNTSYTATLGGTTNPARTYQWQVSTTGTSGTFSNISNTGVYTGTTTATLSLTNVPSSMNGYAYRLVTTPVSGVTVTSDAATLTVSNNPPTWVGASGGNWNTASNWCGGVPNGTAVVIPANRSITISATPTNAISSLAFSTGSSLAINGTSELNVSGDVNFVRNTSISGTGKLVLNGTTIQTITTDSNNTINNLELNNTNGATLAGPLSLTGVFIPTDGVLNTNGTLTLKSSATGTASIASGSTSGSYINGAIRMERYNSAKRAYRSMAHPFSTAIALSQLTDSIDITGAGGSANGFTGNGATTSPSAYWFDASLADTATSGINAGWVAAVSANVASWTPNGLLHLFVRGKKGQGLTNAAYTASASIFGINGEVNQGDQTLTSTSGANSNFVAFGNPFPSSIDLSTVATTNVGANYYVWDATMGTSGAYRTNQFSTSYVLPVYGAFFTNATATSTTATIVVEEADKVAGNNLVHKTTAPENIAELLIADSTNLWDRLLINLNNNANKAFDKLDGKKIANPALDFYTLSTDNKKLAVDVRPYSDKDSIKIGLNAYKRYGKYAIRTDMFSVASNNKLFLHDRYTNKTEELTAGFEYWFEVNADSNSQGNNRFVINVQVAPVLPPNTTTQPSRTNPATDVASTVSETLTFSVVPNPAQNEVKITFEKANGTAEIKLMNVSGAIVLGKKVDTNNGSYTLSLTDIPAGVYVVELQQDGKRSVQKLVKQ